MDAAMRATMTAKTKTHRIFAFSDNVEIFAATRAIFAAVFEKICAPQRAQTTQPQTLQRRESTRKSQGESKSESRGESALAKSKHELSPAKSHAPHKPSPAPRESSTRESGGESRPRESSQIDHSFHIDYFCAPASAARFGAYGDISPLNLKTHAERLLDYDLGFSLHSAQIFPPKLVAKVPCINLHPGYNPHNRGIFPQVFSIINKKPIGATLHFMDAGIDSGEVIAQKELRILPNDTSKSLYARIFAAEIALFQTHIEGILEGVLRGEIKPPKILAKSPANHAPHAALQGNYNSKADFKNLCKINLDAKLTMREALDYLRALSHEPYQNAYFVGESGEKYFVSLLVSKAVGGGARDKLKTIVFGVFSAKSGAFFDGSDSPVFLQRKSLPFFIFAPLPRPKESAAFFEGEPRVFPLLAKTANPALLRDFDAVFVRALRREKGEKFATALHQKHRAVCRPKAA